MKINMAYGKTGLQIDVPDENLAGVLRVKSVPALPNPQAELEKALAHPVHSPALAEIVRNKKSACIVISDITRPVPNKILLPPILRILENSAIPKENIVILIGTGIHRPNLGQELIELVGEDIAKSYRIENHYSKKDEDMVYLGETSQNIPIHINKYYYRAECKIVTGFIEPHLWAGYSGGRKGILPGITGLETMKYMHGYAMVAHPGVRYGLLEGNPFHEAGLEVAQKVGCDFLVNVTLNDKKEITGIFAGDIVQAHLEGCKFCEKCSVVELPEPVDIAVTSNGGHPLDCNLYQSIKGLSGAAGIVKEGGLILQVTRCQEGTGSQEFTALLESVHSIEEFFDRLRTPGFFQPDQWGVQEIYEQLKHVRIALYTEGIPSQKIKQYLLEPVADVNQGISKAIQEYGKNCKIAVIPDGPYVITRTPTSLAASG